jgi:type IV pilus assembly protein PilV
MTAPKINRGVTLIEVMVSLVILAMGLLGVAALQGLGTKFGNKAYFRSQAISQAYDLFDRMRANPGGTSANNYIQDPIPDSYSSDCGRSTCTAADLATYDLVAWNVTNGVVLPGGAGAVTVAGSDTTVVVNWSEDTNADGVAETRSVSVTAGL